MDQSAAQPFSPPTNPPLETIPAPQPILPTPPSLPVPSPVPAPPVVPSIQNDTETLTQPIIDESQALSSPSSPKNEKRPFYLSWIFWLVILLIVNAVLFIFFWVIPQISPPIVIKDQPIGAIFHVDKARVTANSFLVLRAQVDSPLGLTIAKTSLLIPDTYRDFNVNLESGEALPSEFVDHVIPGTTVKATLYKDLDKDGIYNPDIDSEIVTNILGGKSQSTFIIKSSL
jgi:hypothetical protein